MCQVTGGIFPPVTGTSCIMRRYMKRIKILGFIVLACVSFFSGCTPSESDPENSSAGPEAFSELDTENTGPAVYKDGVYQGKGTGYGGAVPVTVTIEGGEITGIVIGEHREDAVYMDEAVKIVDDIIIRQSADVDAVSGATASCVGIKSAVKKALAEAQK